MPTKRIVPGNAATLAMSARAKKYREKRKFMATKDPLFDDVLKVLAEDIKSVAEWGGQCIEPVAIHDLVRRSSPWNSRLTEGFRQMKRLQEQVADCMQRKGFLVETTEVDKEVWDHRDSKYETHTHCLVLVRW